MRAAQPRGDQPQHSSDRLDDHPLDRAYLGWYNPDGKRSTWSGGAADAIGRALEG
jgi:hypothetical protein